MAESNAEFTVQGVESEEDVREIEDELAELKGVMGTDIDADGEAAVKFDHDILSEERVKITVREMGYEVE
ncbi:heavy-metal-associated domain-containing protein [Halalkalicoccus ordinarius]|uniref:heavy-metal-associated domain-containing protein n=1 Tax=Halalkalicoccus ordinarius TaxID=3116651 RepID=UPI00300EF682